MKASLRISGAAKSDIKKIGRYTERHWGASQRNAYIRRLFQCFNHLRDFPLSGKSRDELYPGMRSFPVDKHVVYYYYDAGKIWIANVLHERMDPGLHLVTH